MSKIFYKSLGKFQTWPQLDGISPASLTYDDVLLIPQHSTIKSREEIDVKVKLGPYTLTTPIISAPMDTITGEKMAVALAQNGAIATLPRGDMEERANLCNKFSKNEMPCIYAVSLKNGYEEAKTLKKNGAQVIVVDAANGGFDRYIELSEQIKKELKLIVIGGNIATYDQALKYKKVGLDIAKVGIGPGGTCITRMIAGVGFPQLSAVFETTSAGLPVIADGGIKKPADFAKAIAAGAFTVMIGSIFGGTDETPGEVKNGKKLVRGQASHSYMKDNGVKRNQFRSAEGVTLEVATKGPVSNILAELMGGLRSAMSYTGAKNIEEYQKKAVFTKISEATLGENIPWLTKL